MTRRFWVLLHRYAGLTLAGFLFLIGVTGSLLAFDIELERLISPQLFAQPRPDVPPLGLAALAERAEALVPAGRVAYFYVGPDQVSVVMTPRKDPATGKTAELGFTHLFLDPWSGDELGRRRDGDISEGLVNLMPFIYKLHRELALGETGAWVLGIVALVWTLDGFVAFYLTLPVKFRGFWRRWKPSWLIKWPADFFRLNFDLHRAGGLWVWPLLLIFAWSSVLLDLRSVYDWATSAVLDYRSPVQEVMSLQPHPTDTPRLDWRAAEAAGARLMEEQAASRGFMLGRPVGFGYSPEMGVFFYATESSLAIQKRGWSTTLWLDGDTGELRTLFLPSGERIGNTMTSWLRAFHFADLFDFLPYRIFVCLLGLLVALLSVTGVYIWWRKRNAEKYRRSRRGKRDQIPGATGPGQTLDEENHDAGAVYVP
jgi:uncharacterized iron-regulated membrane protein